MKPSEFNFKVCIPLCNLTLKGYKVIKKEEIPHFNVCADELPLLEPTGNNL